MKKSLLVFVLGAAFGVAVSFAIRSDDASITIHRVIAEPGDRVFVQKSEIYLNGKKLGGPKRLVAEY